MCTCGNCRACKRRAYDRQRWRDRPDRRASSAQRLEQWRLKKQKIVHDYLSEHPCVDCGESDQVVLEFDHVRGEKLDNVANLITGCGKVERLLAEIAKCDVRCANCHRRKTHRDNEWRNRHTGVLKHN